MGGVIFYFEGNKQKDYAWVLGKKSNNVVEWISLIKGLEIASNYRMAELAVFGDSLIVTREARKLNNYKSSTIKLRYILKCLEMEFKSLKFFHILRENNKQEDLMANKGVLLEYGELVYNEERNERSWIP